MYDQELADKERESAALRNTQGKLHGILQAIRGRVLDIQGGQSDQSVEKDCADVIGLVDGALAHCEGCHSVEAKVQSGLCSAVVVAKT